MSLIQAWYVAVLSSTTFALPLFFPSLPAPAQRTEPAIISEAPPLVWPSWLVHLDGVQLKIQQVADSSRGPYLQAAYYTREPMTKIHAFYEDLLKANDYRVVTAGLETGHTVSGTSQNAWGHVEGDSYPNGEPGPYTNVRVDFGRSVLNGQIRVNIKLTAHPQLSYGHEITHKHNLPPLPVPKGSANAREAAVERERKNLEGMEKYDKPVAPRPRPSVTWPAWLGHIEGPALRPQNRGNSMMAASYTTNMDSESIRAFYSDLLSYHGYSVDPLSTHSSRLRTSGTTSHRGIGERRLVPKWHPGCTHRDSGAIPACGLARAGPSDEGRVTRHRVPRRLVAIEATLT